MLIYKENVPVDNKLGTIFNTHVHVVVLFDLLCYLESAGLNSSYSVFRQACVGLESE